VEFDGADESFRTRNGLTRTACKYVLGYGGNSSDTTGVDPCCVRRIMEARLASQEIGSHVAVCVDVAIRSARGLQPRSSVSTSDVFRYFTN
jgi:hypothetical protein